MHSENTPVRAYRLLIEYDGTRYAGWQRQPHVATVQETIESTLERILRHPVRCLGAGRTDAGVHAVGQVGKIETTAFNITEDSIVRGGNTLLPEDIRITEARPCPLDFDPRRDARSRRYRYSLINQPTPSALDRHRLLHVRGEMDWAALEKGLEYLLGEHDFQAFRSSACRAVRTQLTLTRASHIDAHPVHHIEFECRSFLHNMVRIMTGLLIEIARGKHPPEVVREMLDSQKRTRAFRVVLPRGLVLMGVRYPDDEID
ncbi:tRNA pseudouridine(38-40) synthase TruA [bacterium]|nr:tRNA pseudouridine(38-40) synthase TruA [bacterium]